MAFPKQNSNKRQTRVQGWSFSIAARGRISLIGQLIKRSMHVGDVTKIRGILSHQIINFWTMRGGTAACHALRVLPPLFFLIVAMKGIQSESWIRNSLDVFVFNIES